MESIIRGVLMIAAGDVVLNGLLARLYGIQVPTSRLQK
jgi:hypothetical protein